MTHATNSSQASAGEIGRSLVEGWVLLLVAALVGGLLAAGGVLLTPARYTGTVTVLVKLPSGASDAETPIRTIESLALSTVVLAEVADRPGVDMTVSEISDRLTVERAVGSAVVEMSIEDSSPERAQAVVASITPALNNRLGDVRGPEGLVPQSVDTFGAEPYVRETSIALVPAMILGGLAGLLLGALVLAVRAANRRP